MKKFLAFVAVFLLLGILPAHAIDVQVVTGNKTGVKAWLVEDHKLPIISLRFSFQGGIEQDPADKQGLGALTLQALTESGAGPYDAAAFQQRLADQSITITFGAERDELVGGIKCLSADKKAAFDLLRLALTSPRFDAADIERLRARQLSGVLSQYGDQRWQARNALLNDIFPNHPYNQRRLGSQQSLKAITRADIQTYAAAHFALDNLTVAAAGDITPAELSAALDRIFAGLPSRAVLKTIPEVPEIGSSSPIVIRRDGTQTSMIFALSGPKRDDPDYYAAEIANYILGGGGFVSRLMQEVREKKGLTYGISTMLISAQRSGQIIGETDVDNPRATEAHTLIRTVFRRFRDEGPTSREVEAAKDYLTGAMPLILTSTDKIARVLVYLQRNNLGRDYLDRYKEIIHDVTVQDVTRVVTRYFNPEKMSLVLVGKPESIAGARNKETVKQ